MKYTTETAIKTLRAARKRKGLSQSALGNLAGVPQSHISKIENNEVDLRISSLVSVAHALDVEIMLVPRRAVSAVASVIQSIGTAPLVDAKVVNEFRKIEKALESIKTRLGSLAEVNQLRHSVKEISQYQNLLLNHIDRLRNIRKSLEKTDTTGSSDFVKLAVEQMNELRKSLAHTQNSIDNIHPARPAYRLNGDGDG